MPPRPSSFSSPHGQSSSLPALYLYHLNDTSVKRHIALFGGQHVRIGRQTNDKTVPTKRNGYFHSKALSRQHAEVWEENGKIFIRDVKSSNGTFINGKRLSPEGVGSEPFELKNGDIVEFGIDIIGKDNKTAIHHKIAVRTICVFTEEDAQDAAHVERMQNPTAVSGDPSQLSISDDDSARPEKIIERLRHELAHAQRVTEEQEKLLRDEIAQLKQANEQLRNDLAALSSQTSENQEKYQEETRVLQSEIEQWKSSYSANENELATARKTIEELRRNRSQSKQPASSSKARYQDDSNDQCGFSRALPVVTDDGEHIRRRDSWETDSTGEWYVPGYFASKNHVGDSPPEEEFRDTFSLIRSDPADFTGQAMRIMCYPGTLSDQKCLDEDEASFSALCTIHADLSEAMKGLVMDRDDVYSPLDYDVIISFGRTVIRADVCWISETGERRVPARITYED